MIQIHLSKKQNNVIALFITLGLFVGAFMGEQIPWSIQYLILTITCLLGGSIGFLSRQTVFIPFFAASFGFEDYKEDSPLVKGIGGFLNMLMLGIGLALLIGYLTLGVEG